MNSSPKSSFVRPASSIVVRAFHRTRLWAVSMLLLALALGVVAAAQDAGPEALASGTEAADLQAIEAVALDYLEGGRDADFSRLAGAFHESARLQFVKDGSYTEWAIANYLQGRRDAKPREATVKVHSVDLTGSCAVAKVESNYGQVGFVDYLSLLKIDGEWVIVNKVFHRR